MINLNFCTAALLRSTSSSGLTQNVKLIINKAYQYQYQREHPQNFQVQISEISQFRSVGPLFFV